MLSTKMDVTGVVFEETVYQSNGTSIHRSMWEGKAVAVKVLKLDCVRKEEVMNEVQTQRSLQHPGVCPILEVNWQSDCVWLILEWMPSDLHKEIALRRQYQRPWSYPELWTHFIFLLDVFCYAQSLGISHRDIKPQTIFLASDGSMKVGDFGTAKRVGLEGTETLKGSPYYLSPELKVKYENWMKGDRDKTVYDPYRSDVYSLGLTFLHMLLLAPSPELLNLSSLPASTSSLLLSLPPPFQPLFSHMLKVSNRMDFLELRDSLLSPLPLSIPSNSHCTHCSALLTSLEYQDDYGDYCSQYCHNLYRAWYLQGVERRIKIKIRNGREWTGREEETRK